MLAPGELRYALLEECWWAACLSAGALVEATGQHATGEGPTQLRLCGVHHQWVAWLTEHPEQGILVQVWEDAATTLPVVVAVRVASHG